MATILEYYSVDPAGVLSLNLTRLDYALTPERTPRLSGLVCIGIWGRRFRVSILAEDLVVDSVELRRFDRWSRRLCDLHSDITKMMVNGLDGSRLSR